MKAMLPDVKSIEVNRCEWSIADEIILSSNRKNLGSLHTVNHGASFLTCSV